MPEPQTLRPRVVYADNAGRAGFIEDGDGWFYSFGADRHPLGRWSTEKRALHAITQDRLSQLYRRRS